MVVVGLVVTLLGSVISVASLGVTSSNDARLGMVLVGIAVSIFGIVGLINPAYIKTAIWKGGK